MKTTNYYDTFIEVAGDCPASTGEVPPLRGGEKTVARWQYEKLSEAPYELTSDELLFQLHLERNSVSEDGREEERRKFFSKGRPCLRSSPLAKRYGWGFHFDSKGKVAIFAVDSPEYVRKERDNGLEHLQAMRSTRAKKE